MPAAPADYKVSGDVSVAYDPRGAAITPLDYRAWEDHEFEEEGAEDEEEEGNKQQAALAKQ